MDETNEVPTSQESIKTTAEEKPANEPTGIESQNSVEQEEIRKDKQTTEEEKSSHDSKDSLQTTDVVITMSTAAEAEATEVPNADIVDAVAANVAEKSDEVKEKVEDSKDEPPQVQVEADAENEKLEPKTIECKEESPENQESKDEPQLQQVEAEAMKEKDEPKAVECHEESPDNQVDSSASGQLDPGSTNTAPEVLHQETVQIEHQSEKNDVNVLPENVKPEEIISTTRASEIPSAVIISTVPDVPAETADETPAAPPSADTFAKPAGESKRRGSIEKMSNFLRQFRSSGGFKKFTASQFMKVWNHYDSDGNGFIADSELDGFLKEFVLSSVGEGEMRPEILSDSAMAVFKETFMDAFDENQDGMIDIAELAEILPTDENFLLLFHLKNPVESSVEFMRIWREYDKNCNGYIESKELKSFLKHILDNQKTSVSDEKLEEYTETILNLFDSNRDGKLQLCEMARLMPVKQNFLSKPILKGASCITRSDIDRLFKIYDQNRNGTIEDEELSGLLKDLMDLGKKDYALNDINNMKKVIMDHWDLDQDGTISKSELRMFLIQQCKLSAESQGLQYDDEDDYSGDSD